MITAITCVTIVPRIMDNNIKKVDIDSALNTSSDDPAIEIDPHVIIGANSDNGRIGDHIKGRANARVVVIEYGDYQCPGCSTVVKRFNALVEYYGERIGFVFRHFPLSFHTYAEPAARAAEAAGLMGKFWEMHELIYETQRIWAYAESDKIDNVFAGMAAEIGLDTTTFMNHYASQAVADRVAYDTRMAEKLALRGTPTVIINGEEISSSVWGNESLLKRYIDELLE